MIWWHTEHKGCSHPQIGHIKHHLHFLCVHREPFCALRMLHHCHGRLVLPVGRWKYGQSVNCRVVSRCGDVMRRTISAQTTHPPNVWPMLAHRLRRWPNIGQTLGRCVLFAGNPWICGRGNPNGTVIKVSATNCARIKRVQFPLDAQI